MKPLLVFVLLVAQTWSAIEWQFMNDGYNKQTLLRVGIGSPVQQIPLKIILDDSCSGLFVYSAANQPYFGFDSDASSTFQKVGDYKVDQKTVGVYGKDDFTIKNTDWKDQKFEQKPFVVVNAGPCYGSTLSLTYTDSTSKNDFLDSFWSTGDEQIAVIGFDYMPTDETNTTGVLTLGSYPKFCSNKWTTFPGVENEAQWTFKLDRVSVGKFSAYQPGNAQFSIDTTTTYLPIGVYDQIASELDFNSNDFTILCSPAKNISFKINNFQLDLTPDDYSIQLPFSKRCIFTAAKNYQNDLYVFPSRLLGRFCLLLDFKNKAVKISENHGNDF